MKERQLPPGPRMPSLLQALGTWSRPTAFLERARARYGRRFTIRLFGQPPWVMLSDPDEIKELFQAPPDVLHPGEGTRILEPIVGGHSVILLDEAPHLEQRKLMLPAFHGERMQRLAGLMADLAEREVDSWPRGEAIALHPPLQRLTLEIILRAVFGLERGAQLDELRGLLSEFLAFTDSPVTMLPPPPGLLTGRAPGAGRGLVARVATSFGPLARMQRLGARVDELLFELIEERRREGRVGEDVLALLLDAAHEDGSPMSPEELRDELMTALVAGHETTASQLAWAFERLAREPAVLGRLYEELDGDSGEEYLTATVQEILRHRPVLLNAEPRLVMRPVEIGGVAYPPGVALIASAYLLHHDPAIYPEPHALRPERFLERAGGQAPGTYTWIPFGGGRRRCVGANFALLEMKLVLRAVLQRCELHPAGARAERARRRNITVSPARGSLVVLHDRTPTATRATPAGASALVAA
jgi:cytochrome P450